MGKEIKIHGFRYQLLGDSIGSLPLLNFFERKYPGSYKYFAIARKCSHLAPLLIGQKLIDRIHILSGSEGPEGEDFDIIDKCDIVVNGNPEHFNNDYPNKIGFYEETFAMSCVPLSEYYKLPENERYPKLVKWFRPEARPSNAGKIIAIWGFANYGGKEAKRQPSVTYWFDLIERLIKEGYIVCQFGHFNDPEISYNIDKFKRFNDLDFFQQIRMTLSTELVISTDSGSGLIFAAYSHPQINLVNRHWPGHVENRFALAPIGEDTFNFCGETGCNDIDIEAVIAKVIEKTK